MSATGWNFLIEDGYNPESLLSALETDVFNSGRFQIPSIEPEFLDEIEFLTVSDEERLELADDYGLHSLLLVANRVGLANLVAWCMERMQNDKIETLEELRAMQCLSSGGTHSPLDMNGVSDSPKDFKLCPLSENQIIKVFGKSQVQRNDVASMDLFVYGSLPEAYDRWQGVFLPVYTADEPTHTYVEGASGD